MGVFHRPSLLWKSLSCRSYPGLWYGQSLPSLQSCWYGPALLALVCMLELMSVMEPLYPRGISWQLWKVKTPRTYWKVGKYNLVHFLSIVLGSSLAVLTAFYIVELFLHFCFTHRLKGYHFVVEAMNVFFIYLLMFSDWISGFVYNFAYFLNQRK